MKRTIPKGIWDLYKRLFRSAVDSVKAPLIAEITKAGAFATSEPLTEEEFRAWFNLARGFRTGSEEEE